MRVHSLVAPLLALTLWWHYSAAMTIKPFHVVKSPRDIMQQRTRDAAQLYPLTPNGLRKAYNIPDYATGAGVTIAIVSCYDAPDIEADLVGFSVMFGLPNCTVASGCLTKVNQTGGNIFVTATGAHTSWITESTLDVQAVHSIAPEAKIVLVLAKSEQMDDATVAVKEAASRANYISMSWGGNETGLGSSPLTKDQSTFGSYTGKSFFAATGDNGAAVNWPASSTHVVAVGGTSINSEANTAHTDGKKIWFTNNFEFVNETGWSGSGGGCSTTFSAIPVQETASGYSSLSCSKRVIPDAAMVADPNSGLWIYMTSGCGSSDFEYCMAVVGGTSLATPLFAARAALTDSIVDSTYVYGSSIVFRDITSGNNGYSCGVGLDYVTGLGSWINGSFTTPTPDTSSTSGRSSAAVTTAVGTTTLIPNPTTTTGSSINSASHVTLPMIIYIVISFLL